MSTTQDRSQPVSGIGRPARWSRPWQAWQTWTPRRRQWTVLGAAAALVVVAGVAALLSLGSGAADAPTGPVTLPPTVADLNPVSPQADLTNTAAWRAKVAKAVPHGTVIARTYGTGGTGRSIRIVTARVDLTGKLDLAWVADKGRAVGPDRCTQNLQLTPGSRAGIRPTMALCWRTGENVSAYALLVDPKHAVTPRDAADALDGVWSSIARGA